MTSDGDHRPASGPQPVAGAERDRQRPPILDQAFDADSLYALRAAVAAHASQAGLPLGRADDLVIAVHELAANAVRHGAGHGRLRVWQTDQALLCEIADDGAPPPGAQQPGAQQPGAPQQPGVPHPDAPRDAAQWRTELGHGLSLVRQVADQTSLTSGPDGTLATISFALGPPGPPFRLDQRHLDDCTVLAVTGSLDLASAAQLTAAVTALLTPPSPPQPATPPQASALRLVLDLSGLTGWDSSGLAALVTAQKQITANPPARMVLAGLPGHLAWHLRDAGVAGRFTLADSTAAAVAALT
jgi:anti-sigma regulatory factor (Ser/Thr protein kinase)